jgi:pyruvate formate lyase activating enzyme
MNKFFKEAKFYRKEKNGLICETCERECFLREGQTGFCKTRKNINGKIYTLCWGDISSISLNPIEKKPFYHFYPGTYAMTVGSWSCNFTCPWCQNFEISKFPPKNEYYISPEEFIEICLKYRADGTSISFNEPTLLFEWSLEVFKIAKQKNLYNTYVSNGYMTEKVLYSLIDSGLDAINIDLKGDKKVYEKYCASDFEKVYRNIKISSKLIHTEIVSLIITNVNDRFSIFEDIAKRILDEIGDEIPWHITRYFPAYKFKEPETDIKKMEEIIEGIKNLGFKYVYIGNVPYHKYNNTYCPNCSNLLIERGIMEVIENKLKDKKCPFCNFEINIKI